MKMVYFACLFFLAALHAFLTIYINSSLVLTTLGESYIAPVFIFTAIVGCIGFFIAPRLLVSFGNRTFISTLVFLEASALVTVAFQPSANVIIGALCIHLILAPILGFAIDVLFEASGLTKGRVGIARSAMLVSTNSALIIAPFFSGILTNMGYSYVYGASAVVLILFGLIAPSAMKLCRDGTCTVPSVFNTLKTFVGPQASALWAQWILRIFYAWSVIYIPLYLREIYGLSWEQVGFAMTISLLPFVLFELPVGFLAEKVLGEKELMILGFITISCATFILSSNSTLTFVALLWLLFILRIGASLVEVTTEAHFFRCVPTRNTDAITAFRMTGQLGFLVGTAVAGVGFIFFPLEHIFYFFSLVILLGLVPAVLMKDSR